MHERTCAQAGSDGICWHVRQQSPSDTIASSRRASWLFSNGLLPYYGGQGSNPVTEMAMEAEIRQATAVDIYQWLREVCSTKLLATPIQLGGTGVVYK